MKTAGVPRILVTRLDRIGDLVLATPVFEALRKKYPRAWIAAMTFLENREILEGNPYLDEIILYDKKGSEKGLMGQWRFARKLARRKFGIVIHLHATNRAHIASWLAGIPVRIGWDRKASWTLTRVYPDHKKEGRKHEAEYNFELLQELDVYPPTDFEFFFPVPERAEKSLELLLKHHRISGEKPRVLLSPGASCPSKRWPAERFGDAAGRLAREFGAQIVIVGTEKDEPAARKIIERAELPSNSIFDLTGRLSLSMLGALLKKSLLLISNDSGPVHVASAVGTPVISIFGRNQPGLSPRRWRPLGKNASYLWKDVGCHPCLAHNCKIQFLCLEAVTVEDVCREASLFLDSPNSSGLKPAEILH